MDSGKLREALPYYQKVMDKLPWCTIIGGYVQVEKLCEALMMYRSMLSVRLPPNGFVMVDLISAYGRTTAGGEGLQLHSAAVKMGFDSYDFIQATIIHFYAACDRINEACLQFRLGSKANVASWNALIAGFIQDRAVYKAGSLFNEMPERDVFS